MGSSESIDEETREGGREIGRHGRREILEIFLGGLANTAMLC